MEQTHHSSHTDSHEEEHGNGDAEPIIIKRVAVHEKLALEMNENGIDCEALPYGLHELERGETYYSHDFALSSRLVTNKGRIKVNGKNIDFVQILQRH